MEVKARRPAASVALLSEVSAASAPFRALSLRPDCRAPSALEAAEKEMWALGRAQDTGQGE